MKDLLTNFLLIIAFLTICLIKNRKNRITWYYLKKGYQEPKKSKRYLECVEMTRKFIKNSKLNQKGGVDHGN